MKRLFSLLVLAATVAAAQSQAPGFSSSVFVMNTSLVGVLQGLGSTGARPHVDVFIADQGLHADGYRVDLTYVSFQDGVTRQVSHDVASREGWAQDIYLVDAATATAKITPYRLLPTNQ